ncbi:unnamed protein product, partial [Gongylonema pulchrum]|uniref:ACC_central domain-containing protein n=1 Tax=Gongylonema pulchrum TaxID=637853 RepID=A0A183DD94_9BILA
MRIVGCVADIVERLPQAAAKVAVPGTTLYIVSRTGEVRCVPNLEEKFSIMLKEAVSRVQNENIRQMVILIASSDSYPMFFYYDMICKEEIRSQRNIDLAHLPKLGLHRIKGNYNIEKLKSSHNFGHLYKAEGKADPTEHRFFYRAVVRVVDSYTAEEVTCSIKNALKRACGEIAVALYRSNTIDRNHILLFIHRAPTSEEILMSSADWTNVICEAYLQCK